MVKKIVVVFLIFSIIYTLLILIVNPAKWSYIQDLGQDNTLKAQNFLFSSKDDYNKIIVGSSLAERILTDSLRQTVNLAFGGESIYDGIAIVKAKKKYPRFLLIETNMVMRPENSNFTSQFSNPVLLFLKKYVVSFREDKKPVVALAEGTKGLVHQAVLLKQKLHSTGTNRSVVASVNDKVVYGGATKWAVELNRKDFSKLPSTEAIDNKFKELQQDVDFFKKKGCEIIFFEMPINNTLVATPLPVEIRKDFLKYFPENEYKYIKVPENMRVETTDGIHLNYQDATVYTNFLGKSIDSITSENR